MVNIHTHIRYAALVCDNKNFENQDSHKYKNICTLSKSTAIHDGVSQIKI